jgi:hypothetical protein
MHSAVCARATGEIKFAFGFAVASGGRRMQLDELLKLLFFVPTPLRRPTALCVLTMLVLLTILSLARGFGYWDAVWDPIWLYSLASWCVCLVVVAIVQRAHLRVAPTLFWSALFGIVAIAAAVKGNALNAYVYNDLGFLQSRAWTREDDSSRHGLNLWKWQLIAVQDLSGLPLIVELRRTEQCRFKEFWPTSDSSQYTPAIADVSQGALDRRWQIRNLRKPAKLSFHLLIEGRSILPDSCRPQFSIGNGK